MRRFRRYFPRGWIEDLDVYLPISEDGREEKLDDFVDEQEAEKEEKEDELQMEQEWHSSVGTLSNQGSRTDMSEEDENQDKDGSMKEQKTLPKEQIGATYQKAFMWTLTPTNKSPFSPTRMKTPTPTH